MTIMKNVSAGPSHAPNTGVRVIRAVSGATGFVAVNIKSPDPEAVSPMAGLSFVHDTAATGVPVNARVTISPPQKVRFPGLTTVGSGTAVTV